MIVAVGVLNQGGFYSYILPKHKQVLWEKFHVITVPDALVDHYLKQWYEVADAYKAAHGQKDKELHSLIFKGIKRLIIWTNRYDGVAKDRIDRLCMFSQTQRLTVALHDELSGYKVIVQGDQDFWSATKAIDEFYQELKVYEAFEAGASENYQLMLEELRGAKTAPEEVVRQILQGQGPLWTHMLNTISLWSRALDVGPVNTTQAQPTADLMKPIHWVRNGEFIGVGKRTLSRCRILYGMELNPVDILRAYRHIHFMLNDGVENYLQEGWFLCFCGKPVHVNWSECLHCGQVHASVGEFVEFFDDSVNELNKL